MTLSFEFSFSTGYKMFSYFRSHLCSLKHPRLLEPVLRNHFATGFIIRINMSSQLKTQMKRQMEKFLSLSKISAAPKPKSLKEKKTKGLWDAFNVLLLNCVLDELNGDSFVFTIKVLDAERLIEQIEGFVVCKKCSNIYVYNSKDGTSTLKKHSCASLLTGGQSSLDNFVQRPQHQIQRKNRDDLPVDLVQQVRDSELKFVVNRLRPFSVVEDSDFINFLQTVSDISADFGKLNMKSISHSTKSLTQRSVW